jgi:addiction module HigA family antidote
MNNLQAKKDLLTCPGDTIQENIDLMGMSQAELAVRMGRTKENLNEIIKGKSAITIDTASRLEYVLGIPSNFWLELERDYQEELMKIERMEFYENCLAWLKSFPIGKMKKLDILPDTNDKSALVYSLLRFFRVASPKQWEEVYRELPLSFELVNTEKQAVSVWLRYGEIQAEKITLSQFDKKGFKDNLHEVKEISYNHAENWQSLLQQYCSRYGVALVYTPSISKTPIYGATRWIKNHTVPLLQITDKCRDSNTFWFTFFHEAAHIILHGKKDVFLEVSNNIQTVNLKEIEADEFAGNEIIQKGLLSIIKSDRVFKKDYIIQLSKEYKVHAGIIVSQLQRLGKIEYGDKLLKNENVRLG